jgi:predicted enzyme related to lactoylglutathione lyase
MPNPVVHFEVVGKDGKALQSFYSEVFEWKIDASNPMDYGIVDTGVDGASGGGVSGIPDGESPHAIFYIGVDDPQATLDQVVERGGAVVMEVTEIPEMVTFAMFKDPEGNVVGLVKN